MIVDIVYSTLYVDAAQCQQLWSVGW